MDRANTLNIYTDGGSRGNPGLSALGVYVENGQGLFLDEIGKTLGINTNNFAEYSAIVEGLSWVLSHKPQIPGLVRVNFFMDSNLAASQLNGLYRIKNADLRELYFSAKKLEAQINLPIYYTHIPREQNKKADRLVNIALDSRF